MLAGEVVQSWGGDYFYMPHMVTVDNAGFVWTTDVGLHTACKFTAAGERVLCLGVPLEPGHDERHLCKPTQARLRKHSPTPGSGLGRVKVTCRLQP